MTSYPPAPPPGGAQASGPQQGGSQPVCPRHPKVVSYVSCQRCNRPVCPPCQRIAPVGVHCVDCAQAAERSARPERTITGGRQSRRPYVTFTMMALCIGVYVLELVLVSTPIRSTLAFSPLAGAAEPWRMITTAFLHGGVLHLALNMYALWVVGPFLERYLGVWRFLSLYLLSAFAGSVAVLLLTPMDRWHFYTVGASGAVFGLFAACALLLRRLGGNYRQMVLVVVANVVISFIFPMISWQAHLGGMAVGALITLVYLRLPKEHRTSGAILALSGIAVVLVAVTYLLYASRGF